MKKGGKYNPYTIKTDSENLELFDREFASTMNNLLKWIIPNSKLIDNRNIVNSMNALKKYFLGLELHQNVNLVSELVHRYLSERRCYKADLLVNVYKGVNCDVPQKELDGLFHFNPDIIFLDGDKNIGFVCMTVKDLMAQYDKVDAEQCFEKVDIEEADYLRDIMSYVRDAKLFLPNELANIVPKSCFA